MKKTTSESWIKQTGQFLLSSPYLLWGMLILILVLFTLAQTFDQNMVSYAYRIGDVVNRDIKAPKDFFIEDKEINQAKKNQVKETIRTVYDLDDRLLADISANIESAMELGRTIFILPTPSADAQVTTPPEPTFAMAMAAKPEFEKRLGIEISKGAYQVLFKQRFSKKISQYFITIVGKILANGIVANKEILLAEEGKGISLRTIQSGQERMVVNLKAFYGPDQAKTMVRIIGQPLLKEVNYSLSNLIVDISQRLLRPNITLNKNETEKRIQQAQANINPTLYQIKAGEMIIREGERVDKLKRIKLNALNEQVVEKDIYMSMSGLVMLTCILILVVYYLFLKDHPKLKPDMNKHMIFLAMGLALYLGFAELAVYLAHSANPEMPKALASRAVYMAVPIPAAAMITCLFLGFDIALFFTLVLSILSSLSFGNSFQVFIFFFLSSITAAYWIKERDERRHFIVAGFKLALFNASLAIALGFFTQAQLDPMLLTKQVILAVCGGVGAAILTVGFSPLIEVLFNYTTAAKLLEFSNLDQPLIKKLMIEAPGTYNHSVIVATLSEAAASAINADSLKAKVMAYYHDIGKLDKTMYFIENQADGKNRHDKLSPSMSALILIQHVKKGVEMAKKYKLGNEIIEGIIQHHGTSLIKYFYNKSLNSGNENVKKEDFRYPGPKPQTREAGIVMLADVVEAAVRALERPTPARIQGRVKELINDIFADGQLEECEMTLKDLHQIAKSFNNILTSIYHSRIEYTDKSQDKKKEKNGTPKDTDRQPARSETPNAPNPSKDRTDLKRLGL
ncbi:MAG: HDIG domain-containing protein [Desulfobacter sp.]|nr:HDIG domain-containing protein [Desulfobacter sp.]WDP87109.1 MAG: HDIG domain-containing protein [Desulfobacter sp.]